MSVSELDVATGIGESRVRRALFCPSKSPLFFRMLAERCPVLLFVDRRAVVTDSDSLLLLSTSAAVSCPAGRNLPVLTVLLRDLDRLSGLSFVLLVCNGPPHRAILPDADFCLCEHSLLRAVHPLNRLSEAFLSSPTLRAPL